MNGCGLDNVRSPNQLSKPPSPVPQFGTAPGTYVLFVGLAAAAEIEIGRLGAIHFAAGCYAYIGSALGPGGLEARLNRHLRAGKRRHWHIDYLREAADVIQVWTIAGHERLECQLAELLASTHGANAVASFGASDCRCNSHLVALPRLPARSYVLRRLRNGGHGIDGLRIRELTP